MDAPTVVVVRYGVCVSCRARVCRESGETDGGAFASSRVAAR